MKGSILCAGALLCSIFTVYSLVHPMDGVYGCILAIFLAVASSIFLKLGIDNIYVAIENQNELMKQSLSNKDDVVKLIDEKIKEVYSKLQEQQIQSNQSNAAVMEKLASLLECVQEERKQCANANLILLERFSGIDEKLIQSNKFVTSKLDDQTEMVNKIMREIEDKFDKKSDDIKQISDRNKACLDSIESQLCVLDKINEAAGKCAKEIKRHRDEFSDFIEDIEEDCGQLSESIEKSLAEIKTQNTNHIEELEGLRKHYTSLSKKDMEILSKLSLELK